MWTTALSLVLAGSLGLPAGQPRIAQGPFVGHVTSEAAMIWARLAEPEPRRTVHLVIETGPSETRTIPAVAEAQRDHCVVWSVSDLRPGTTYRYRIPGPAGVIAGGASYRFTTAPRDGDAARVTIAFGSCAEEDEPTARVWDRIGSVGPDAIVLLGDTPYIDATDLATQRRRHREFASVSAMQRVLCRTPTYAVWDDHDFGRNNANGNLPGKESS